ncbi:hypothetical protein KUV46_06225 [Thalassovita mediterranea]|nr:hypothetical protein KUV46_06225 [Thalassovita mediterranea]
MKYLLCGVAAISILTACDQTGVETPEDISEITLREGDAAEAPDVISAMMLTNSGDGMITYASKEVDGATATFSGIGLNGMDGLTADSLVFEGLDMVDGQASFSRMSFSGLSFTAPEDADTTTMGIGEIELINPSPALSAWVASALGTGEPAEFPAVEDISFDAWSVTDVSGEFSGTDGEGTYGVSSLQLRGVEDQRAALAELTGVTFDIIGEDEMNFKGGIDSLSIAGSNLNFLSAIQQNAGDEDAMAAAVMSSMMQNPMDPGYDRITLDNMTFEGEGMSFALASLDAYVERNNDGQPTSYVTEPFTMTLNADADGGEVGAGLAQGLSMLGYDGIEIRGAGRSDYDPESDVLTSDAADNYFELVDGARFSYGGEFIGYSAFNEQLVASMDMENLAEGGEPDPMVMQQALGALEIGNFELRITDDGLVDRVFNVVATQQGQDPAQMRAQVAQMMGMAPLMAQQAGVDPAIATELGTALSSFIQEPKTLTIMLDPEEPISMESVAAMEDPSMLTKGYLGLSASNE